MVYPNKQKNSATQELMFSLLECCSGLGQAYATLITQIIYSDIYEELWDLYRIDMWYIWCPKIYIFITNKQRHLFCHINWRNFVFVFFISKTQYSSPSSSYRWDVTKSLIYRTPSTSSSNYWENFVKLTLIGSQRYGDMRLICRHSHICLSYGVCVS